MKIYLDHIAILTSSLTHSVSELPSSFVPQEVEEQPKEGTWEQYVHGPSEAGPSLLLMQPFQAGPYQSAIEKRGAGLHHLGLSTNHLEDGVEYFAKQGLLLHPISLTTYAKRTVWMCRPGIPFLLELYQPSQIVIMEEADRVSIDLPYSSKAVPFIDFIPGVEIRFSETQKIGISIGNHHLVISL